MPINGMKADAIAASMRAYRSGDLPSTLMGRLMHPFTTAEIDAISAWVSEQPR